jgi:hypothetical protein
MFDITSAIAKGVIEKGYEAFVKNNEYKYLTSAVKEQLRREMRLNVEIISELIPNSKDYKAIEVIHYNKAFEALRTTAFDSIASGIVPLSKLLSNEIDSKIYSKTKSNYIDRCKNYKMLYQLIEQTYLRIKISKVYSASPGSKLDVEYLKFLLLSSIKALK